MKNSKLLITVLTLTVMASPILVMAQAANPGQTFLNTLQNITKLAMNVLIGVGVLFLVLAGFYFVFARGDESKLGTARSMLLWSVIGIAVGVLAPVFIDLATSFVGKWW